VSKEVKGFSLSEAQVEGLHNTYIDISTFFGGAEWRAWVEIVEETAGVF
jgi:hypothetical protein